MCLWEVVGEFFVGWGCVVVYYGLIKMVLWYGLFVWCGCIGEVGVYWVYW